MRRVFVMAIAALWQYALWAAPNTVLRVTELHCNPADETVQGTTIKGENLEFIELKNTSAQALTVSEATFVAGISYVFPANTTIAAGQYYVIARNAESFTNLYGFAPQGVYSGKLSNEGEKVSLTSALGETLIDFEYKTSGKWPQLANKAGFSMVAVSDSSNLSDASGWSNSAIRGGSPGKVDAGAKWYPISITEVLANSTAPQSDAVELYNAGTEDIDIGGWKLTDDVSAKSMFVIPDGTVIKAKQYLVFYECSYAGTIPSYSASQFGANFRLSSNGDNVFLLSAQNGVLSGFCAAQSFAASDEAVTFGQVITSNKKAYFVAMSENTLGSANSELKLPEVVIDEIMYNPIAGCEYLRLKNVSDSKLDLFDTLKNGWDIKGIDFTPDSLNGVSLEPQACLYLIEDSVMYFAFREMMNLPETTPIKSFAGALSNGGEKLELMKPGVPYYNSNDSLIVPYVLVDVVDYNNKQPWPLAASNDGKSLNRISATVFGSEPTNWTAGGQQSAIESIGTTHVIVTPNGISLPSAVEYDEICIVDYLGRILVVVHEGSELLPQMIDRNSGLYFVILKHNNLISFSGKFLFEK